MVAIVTGANLGLFNSSLSVLGSQGSVGNASLGQGNENIDCYGCPDRDRCPDRDMGVQIEIKKLNFSIKSWIYGLIVTYTGDVLNNFVSFICIVMFTLTISACGGSDNGDKTDGGDGSGGSDTSGTEGGVSTVNTPADPPGSVTAVDYCLNYIAGTSDDDDFLCAHNDVRQSVTPVAEPALEGLIWDAELALLAEGWAAQCNYQHNQDRTDIYNVWTSQNTVVGENLYLSSYPVVTAYDAVNAWAKEVLDYDYATNTCTDGAQCGHYTQIVWRETTRVGCAANFCPTITGSQAISENATLVVCNYAVAGNEIGKKPY